MKGDFILQAQGRAPRQGRRPPPQAGLDRPNQPRPRLALRRRRGPRRRPHVPPVPSDRGRHHRAGAVLGHRGRTSFSSRGRATPTSCRSPASATPSPRARSPTWPSATRSTSASSSAPTTRTCRRGRSSGTCGSPSRQGRLRAVPGLHRQPPRDPRRRQRRSQVIHSAASPSRPPTGRATARALIYNSSGSRGPGRLYRFDLATRQPPLIDTGFATRQQQRPRPVVRRHDDRHQPSQRRTTDAVHRLHPARQGGTPKRITRHRAVLSPRLVARRRSSWSTPGGATTSSTSTRSRSDGSGTEITPDELPRAWTTAPSTRPDGKLHLLQLHPQRDHADLADEAGRQRTRSRSPTTSTTTGSPTSPPTVSGSSFISLPQGREPRRSSVLQAASTIRLMPITGGAAQGDRLRLRRPGHDQRPVLVPGREELAFVSNSAME